MSEGKLYLVPAGWKVVPIEPTPEMVSAADMGWEIQPRELRKRLRIYRAMIDAAPNAAKEKSNE